jgi:hypothetical protein
MHLSGGGADGWRGTILRPKVPAVESGPSVEYRLHITMYKMLECVYSMAVDIFCTLPDMPHGRTMGRTMGLTVGLVGVSITQMSSR